ncbi:MAG: hypothetical protein JNL82_13635 [Myxococcales bacterium]|nr:hypothetical protein [Myxococcales bacterium]
MPHPQLRLLVPLFAAALTLLPGGSARAEPPAMKERQTHPRLEVASKDGRFSVAVGGFLQARYAAEFTARALLSSRFGVPRTRLYVFGRLFSRDIRYRLMLGTAPYATAVELFDAYVEWWARPGVRVRGGYFKIPVLREWVESARLLGSVERSASAQLLSPGRHPGVMLSGGLADDAVEYWLGVFGGAGQPAPEPGPLPVAAGRVVWNTTGRTIEGEVDLQRSPLAVSLGASGYAAFRPLVGGRRPRELLGGVELAVRARGLDAAVEVALRDRDDGSLRERVAAGYARANYFVRPARTAFGLRASQIVGLDDPSRTRTDLDLDVTTLLGGHDLKLQLSGGPAYLPAHHAWEGQVQVQVQAAF